MNDKLEKEANSIGGVHPDWGPLECFRGGFKEGARWQLANMWTLTIEGLPEDGINTPKFMQRIPCLIYSGGLVIQSDRIYEDAVIS